MGRALRVAIIGSGPAGFYAAGHLLAKDDPEVEVDLYERLPTPWGLVRSGVAPDHPKIKSVTRIYDKTAAHPRLRWFGNIEIGRHVHRDELVERYDAVVYAVGAETDRPLRIPGSDLPGVWPATRFVGWYNGHPDHRDHPFDLGVHEAVVIGNGNVAVDVARMLCLSHEELRVTDVADHALEALRDAAIRDVTLLGRRGPVQAAFTTPELRELGELDEADVDILPADLELDEHSAAFLADGATPTAKRNVELLNELSARPPQSGKPKTVRLRFLRSPVELRGEGRVEEVVVARNELVLREDGSLAARPTGETETLPAGLVLSSIGYRGRPLPGVPFDEDAGVIPNEGGRVTGGEREYVTGWIKRGPSGIIGTNKKDAQGTVTTLLADLAALGDAARPSVPDGEETARWLAERHPDVITLEHWLAIDRHEQGLGEPHGRPRVKLTRIEELLAACRPVESLP
jgi:ferredoxin--NADP+ reductase